MSFKDFIAFMLRMSGFWLVINTLVGVSHLSSYMYDRAGYAGNGESFAPVLIAMIMPLLIGGLLAFIPYKISNFFILDDVEVKLTPEFCLILTRIGVALIGIYIIVTGIQFLVYNAVLLKSYPPEYLEQNFRIPSMKGSFMPQLIRVIAGFGLLLGSNVISKTLTRMWFKAKSI